MAVEGVRRRMRLRFWGVRGSTPTPQIENLGYGGNTPCLEVRGPADGVLIFDGGTGLRRLGSSLLSEPRDGNLRVHFFSTHLHWDHIQGIPFFGPLYQAGHEVTFYSSVSNSIRQALEGQMATPYFPVSFESAACRRDFVDLESAPVESGSLTIRPFPLNHPQTAIGYRIESPGAVIVYASDLEHGHAALDSVLRDYAQNADVLVYDAQYTPDEYPSHRGWGHSTWEQGVRVARDAGVRQLVLFHHDPSHDDQFVFRMTQEARRQFENTEAAREGWEIVL